LPGPRIINGRTCTVQCGIDRRGGDYGRAYTGSFEGCVQACAANSICVTAQYHGKTGWCYLKNSRNRAETNVNDDTVDCESKPATTTTTSSSSTTTTTSATTTTSSTPLLAQGATCIRSSQCASGLCTSTNYCGPLPRGYFCGINSECISNNCYKDPPSAGYGECRDAPATTTTTTTTATTTTTTATTTTSSTPLLAQGATCIRSSQCASNLCTSTNYCGPLPRGYFCGINSECVSNYCYKDPPTSGYGECRDPSPP
jgi:hypothetical protein